MFTRFSQARPRRAGSIGGTLASVTTHAALVVVAVGGDLVDRSDASTESIGGGGGGGETIHWVGTIGEGGPRALRPGDRLPIAYVVPGRGSERAGTPVPAGPRRRARGTDATDRPDPAPDPTPPAEEEPRRRVADAIALPILPTIADVDVPLLVSGVLSSAPDLTRLASRPEDFVPPPQLGLDGTALDAPLLRLTDRLETVGSVDMLPIALRDNPRPSYPAELQRARVSGRVLVEFRVDSAGVVELASLRVLQSSNALFTRAVQAVLPALRFLPAQLGRQPVSVTVRQPFEFRMRSGL